jgi:hypothetical protein
MMVVPVNPYVNEAENVTQKNRKELCSGLPSHHHGAPSIPRP